MKRLVIRAAMMFGPMLISKAMKSRKRKQAVRGAGKDNAVPPRE